MADTGRSYSSQVISVHLYSLREGVTLEQLREAAREAAQRGLFDLPGLIHWWFAEHIKGSLPGRASAFWVYRSRGAWEALWGTLENPVAPPDYPETWVIWEQEYLGRLLDRAADSIVYGSYQTWLSDQSRSPQLALADIG